MKKGCKRTGNMIITLYENGLISTEKSGIMDDPAASSGVSSSLLAVIPCLTRNPVGFSGYWLSPV
ncbi:MAG: hypothetical protein CO106_01750 [Deltaproteobacteria bacterium CG_4_9_14_3_um_filter_44_9]|nr:MAG: hypothetical protein CO106_01750 [Deltaproteobacteria bacterium CG_4_9_14_3_um_filter_44_9]